MAFVALSGGQSGNLDNYVVYDYGFFNDFVLVRDGNSFRYDIFTFEGDDVVYNTRTTGGSNFTGVLVRLGEGNDRFYGGADFDLVVDGSGNDLAFLGAGNDAAEASAGNDTLDGGEGFDEIRFSYQNYDGYGASVQNFSGVTVDLALTTAQNFGIFGIDKITGFEKVIGSFGSDRILGTNGANEFQGFGGNDYYDGRGGNDSIFAFGGAETIIGGGGADTINIGESTPLRDTLRYTAVTDSGITAATRDTIFTFSCTAIDATNHDVFDFATLDGNLFLAGNQAFTWRGNATAFGTFAGGEVRVQILDLNTAIIHIDTDADVADEMTIQVYGPGTLNLQQSDFIL